MYNTLEAYLNGNYTKYNTNIGGVDTKYGIMETPSHFSYDYSNKKLLVLDLQGKSSISLNIYLSTMSILLVQRDTREHKQDQLHPLRKKMIDSRTVIRDIYRKARLSERVIRTKKVQLQIPNTWACSSLAGCTYTRCMKLPLNLTYHWMMSSKNYNYPQSYQFLKHNPCIALKQVLLLMPMQRPSHVQYPSC